ncbi:exopolyphosphatase [Gluconobacter sp. DsW_056]|uniref:Ppx/GppA phosphatase family protein n=1 Tax=Gluconobacter sp. DsW_056 TaxID=1511209 RepID=UPI000A36E274|nr:Ppx/GppA phosphatase family protein [Gluconobacter sp. DsW_056]OUI83502.1 exopolyphosphatase [Gluconobacter sp. DsW_056]
MMRYGTDHNLSGPMPVHASARRTGPFFGAIDLGTNNCRLMIAAGTPTGFRVVDSFNRSVRLGEGLRASGRLAEDSMKRALDALRVCAERMRQWPLVHVRAVATEACRQAANGREFLARVQHETGLTIDIITAREEAELALESCSPLFRQPEHRPVHADRGVLFDIGGGSTEVAWVRIDPERQTQTLIGTTSVPVGVITLQEMFGEGHGSSYETMVSHVQEYLKGFENVHRIRREVTHGKTRLIGTSGTVTTLAGVALSLPRYNRAAIDGLTLPGHSMMDAIGSLRGLDHDELAEHPCVGAERMKFVLPGCAIFEAIHRLWPVEDVTIADRGLRDGMLLRMARDHGQRSGKGRHTTSRHATPRSRGPFGTYATI